MTDNMVDIFDSFVEKLNGDAKNIKKKANDAKNEIGIDVYNKALDKTKELAKVKLQTLKNNFKSNAEKVNVSVFESASQSIYEIAGFLTERCYFFITLRDLRNEKEETFNHRALLASTFIVMNAVGQGLFQASFAGQVVTRDAVRNFMAITAIILAPLVEEHAKSAALKVSKKVALEYTALFAGFEAGMYVVGLWNRMPRGPLIIGRIMAFCMHMVTTLAQSFIKDKFQVHYIAYIIGVVLHAIWNSMMD